MLDLVKDEKLNEFKTLINSMLSNKLIGAINEYKQPLDEEFTISDIKYLSELLTFLGFGDIEEDGTELSAVTDNFHIVRNVQEQLESTNANYSIEIISEIDDFEGETDSDGIVFDSDDVLFDDYSHIEGDHYVITIQLDGMNEASPFKRTTQVGIKNGKRVRKLVKSGKKGFRRGKDGKTVKQKSSEKIRRARGARKATAKKKGKAALRVRKFKKSIKKSKRISNRAKRRA